MKAKRKVTLLMSLLLIMAMTVGNVAYAAQDSKMSESQIDSRRYEILDGIVYGLSFNGSTANCYAYVQSAHATKYVVSGKLQKKNSSGVYDYVYTWPEETHYGPNCNWDKYCNAAGSGEYKFTFYVDVYNGSQCESLVFTKTKTR